jgi:integrase
MPVGSYKEDSKTLYWCRIWYYKNHVKKSKYKKGFDGKKKAEAWGDKEKKRLEGLQAGADKTTVSEFLERWIKTKEKKLSPTTLSGYKVNIKHINEYIGDTRLYDLKLMDVQEMLDNLTDEELKYRTVKYVLRTLHAAMEYAIKNEDIEKNPCKGAEIAEDDEKFEVIVYSVEDLNNLIELLREQGNPLYPYVLLSSLRGLRRGECLGLRWADIDFEKGEAHIVNNYVVVNKIGYHRKVKTKESDRLIDMEGFVGEELQMYKKRMNAERKRVQKFVCELPDGTLPDPSHISRNLKVFQKSHDLPECRFHDLRHTFAVLQLEGGTDLDTLKRLLGHSKIGITSDLYLHENMNLIKKASRKMDNIINIHCDKIVTNLKDGSTGNL